MCGENFFTISNREAPCGPSPRVWGERYSSIFKSPFHRTIPTCVGRTSNDACASRSSPDHPHVCGENCFAAVEIPTTRGPSPRVWGEPRNITRQGLRTRTIPTCVGRTALRVVRSIGISDHPHVCGENSPGGLKEATSPGPSPRVWGELLAPHQPTRINRTIPTCVGRTPQGFDTPQRAADHPHVCGENS